MKKLKERSLTKEEMKAFDNVNQMESIHYVITKKEESLRKHALNLNDIEKKYVMFADRNEILNNKIEEYDELMKKKYNEEEL